MIFVLDASAMVAYLGDERGSDIMRSLLRDPAHEFFSHAVNLCEVFYGFRRSSGAYEAFRAIRDLKDMGIVERDDMSDAFWQAAGTLKAAQRRVSLADCFAITLANNLEAELVTTDHHELDSIATQNLCRIRFLR